MTYPDSRPTADVDVLAGVAFPDPYRWLEGSGEDVRLWQKAQAELASAHVEGLAGFETIKGHVDHYLTDRLVTVPRKAGASWFRAHLEPGGTQASAVVSEEPYGEGRVLWDPMAQGGDHPPFLSWVSPSPDGSVLAIGVCTDGSENNTMRLIDVASGELLPDAPPHLLMDNWLGGAQWFPDSSGFVYTALGGDSRSADYHAYRHVLGQGTTELDVPWTTPGDYKAVTVSEDGAWFVAHERLMNPIPVAIASTSALDWRPFITSGDSTVVGFVRGGAYFGITDVDAPRGRLVRIALDNADADDPTTWTTVVPESEAVLRTVTPVADVLYLSEIRDTYSFVRIVGRDGVLHGEVPLPAKGVVSELPFPIMNIALRGDAASFVFGFCTLTQSWATLRHEVGGTGLEELRPPLRTLNATVEDCFATSTDGTLIPYHVVRPLDVPGGPRPTLIYAYGGFNAPWSPQYPMGMAAFIAAGGTFVHAHLRGGAEYGRDWWEGGRLRNKQNCYDDLYAVAEELIGEGVTTSSQLAVTGGSNGGLLCGVAVTQRPDLWAAVVPRAPLLDVIGGCREPYGRFAIATEFGDPTDPDEVRRMATFSPYHLVKDGTTYPAVFLDAGDTDPRCSPWHARKLAARLQAAQAGEAPILVHIWENVGHGWATERSVSVVEQAEGIAFIAKHTGLIA